MKLTEPLQSVSTATPRWGFLGPFVLLALVSTKSICCIRTLKLFYPLLQPLVLDLHIKALLLADRLPAVNKLLTRHSPASFTRMTESVNNTAASPILWISVLMHT